MGDVGDEKLLDVRMCDLGLRIEGTELEAADRQVDARARGARRWFRPHYWLSDEWFTPDGVPGIAIPFYLAHPRLAKLELAQMLEVEGGDADVPADPAPRGRPRHRQRLSAPPPADAATAVRQRRRRPIPSTTRRNRTARASSSTWITGTRRAIRTRTSPRPSPSGSIRSRMWSTRYAGWPAQRKLEYMDRLMRELASRRPRVDPKRMVDPLPRLRKTLGEHYREEARALRPRSSRLLRQRPAQSVLRRARSTRRTRRPRGSSGGSAARCAARSPASPTATSTRSIS